MPIRIRIMSFVQVHEILLLYKYSHSLCLGDQCGRCWLLDKDLANTFYLVIGEHCNHRLMAWAEDPGLRPLPTAFDSYI
jgi:hypothetical protein